MPLSTDDAGNRTLDSVSNPQIPVPNGTAHAYTPDNLNQLTDVSLIVNGITYETQPLMYDLNGNMISDATNKTFEWDAANRMVAINYVDTGKRTEFAYDGANRRVKIVEKGAGQTAVAQPAGITYSDYASSPFTATAGNYTISFEGLDAGPNNVALIDAVSLNDVLVANGSFETPPLVGVTEIYNPTNATWSFEGNAGIAGAGSALTDGNPAAPAGTQVGFVQSNDGVIRQTVTLAAGTYTLAFKAAQSGGNKTPQQMRVTIEKTGLTTTVQRFVWSGNTLAEERDSSGATVNKRFFPEGEQRWNAKSGTMQAFYYTRDHLGSIREVADASGALKARYDYDLWGNSAVLSGNMNLAFGYTGHYFHQLSGLNLAMYRAYSPTLGRWLSRDPIGEAGGVNLYRYVSNDSPNNTDSLGLLVDAYFNIAQGILTVIDRDTGAGVIVHAHAGSGPYQGDPTATWIREHRDANGDLVGGPIPQGRYDVLNDLQGRGWYDLDMQDRIPGNDTNDSGPFRSALRLHPGTLSTGCVTVPDSGDYENLNDILANTRTTSSRDASGRPRVNYGTLNVFSTTSPRAVFP